MDTDTRIFRRVLAASLIALVALVVWIVAAPNPAPDGRTVLAFVVAGVAIIAAFGAGKEQGSTE